MSELNLPACPICRAPGALTPHTQTVKGHAYTWHECPACGSVLLAVDADHWAYQKVGVSDQEHLLKRPLTAAELYTLIAPHVPRVERAEPPPAPSSDWLASWGARDRAEPPAAPESGWYTSGAAPQPAEPPPPAFDSGWFASRPAPEPAERPVQPESEWSAFRMAPEPEEPPPLEPAPAVGLRQELGMQPSAPAPVHDVTRPAVPRLFWWLVVVLVACLILAAIALVAVQLLGGRAGVSPAPMAMGTSLALWIGSA